MPTSDLSRRIEADLPRDPDELRDTPPFDALARTWPLARTFRLRLGRWPAKHDTPGTSTLGATGDGAPR